MSTAAAEKILGKRPLDVYATPPRADDKSVAKRTEGAASRVWTSHSAPPLRGSDSSSPPGGSFQALQVTVPSRDAALTETPSCPHSPENPSVGAPPSRVSTSGEQQGNGRPFSEQLEEAFKALVLKAP